MSRRSRRARQEADVEYPIAMPFSWSDSCIYLFDEGDRVELVLGDIPTPVGHDVDQNYPGNLEHPETMRVHATAKWVLREAERELDAWDLQYSWISTCKPNHHLRDIHFECDREEVDEAVLAAKRFLTELEEGVVAHSEAFRSLPASPADRL